MIDADFIYVRAESAEDAVAAWREFAEKEEIGGNRVSYLGGSTEIVTGARKAAPLPAVVIDVKRIDEARVLAAAGGRIRFGAALSLNESGDSGLFPLLSAVLRGIADRTTRNRLSLGGNVAGTLPYREAALPLLLADATILTIRPGPKRGPGQPGGPEARGEPIRSERPFRSLFQKRLRLEEGELILAFSIDAGAAALPWKRYRAVRTAPVDYPLVTACFMDRRQSTKGMGSDAAPSIEAAVSGLLPYPAYFDSVAALAASLSEPSGARSDQRASAEYRIALARDMIRNAEEELP